MSRDAGIFRELWDRTTPPARLADVARTHPDAAVRRSAITPAQVPLDVLTEFVTSTDPDDRAAAARSRALTHPLEEQLATDPILKVRLALARSETAGFRRLHPSTLETLAHDKSVQVRRALLQRDGDQALPFLLHDRDPGLRAAVAARSLTSDQRMTLVRDPDLSVRTSNARALAGQVLRPPQDLLDIVLADPSPRVRVLLTTARWIAADEALTLARDPSVLVRKRLAASAYTQHKPVRALLLTDTAPQVRAVLAATSTHLTSADRDVLSRDGDPKVRAALASRVDIDGTLLQRLIEDPNSGVRDAAGERFLNALTA